MHLVVGDIHGCYKPFKQLLKKANFHPQKDHLWLTGDLVNRGPKSADVIRYVMDLDDHAQVVLGNHDLHLLAIAAGISSPKRGDNSHKLLDEPDSDILIEWLNSRPLALYCKKFDFLLVHAAVHKQWSCQDVLDYAGEIEAILQTDERLNFFKNMYGNSPVNWDSNLKKWERLRFITNVLTRSRFFRADGSGDLSQKGPPGTQPKLLYPWYETLERKTANQMIFFGHWSALGVHQSHNTMCLDSGYLWGGKLSAIKLKKKKEKLIQIDHD